ncbi:MAG: hypothetical protein M9941_12745 [Anaerolineae bacterium]|nr:hypothetical protein [Anaerolineae bacterium]MCO5198603.1 hypothetical protein [Anaerolineae bacterium]
MMNTNSVSNRDKKWFFAFLIAWIVLWIIGLFYFAPLFSDYGTSNAIEILVNGDNGCCIGGFTRGPETPELTNYPVGFSVIFAMLFIGFAIGTVYYGYKAYFKKSAEL